MTNCTSKVFIYLLAEGIVNNVIADYLWARAVVLTSATVATVGLSITIPIAIITDVFLGKQQFALLKLSGAFLVLIGFFVVNLSGSDVTDENLSYSYEYITTEESAHVDDDFFSEEFEIKSLDTSQTNTAVEIEATAQIEPLNGKVKTSLLRVFD